MSELNIDAGDPETITAAIRKVKAQLRKLEHRFAAATENVQRAGDEERAAGRELERSRAMLGLLEKMGELFDETAADSSAEAVSSKERALQLVTAINGPTNVAEVAEHMPDFNRRTVGWALWKLANEGAIQRIGHGRYAPAGYRQGQVTTNYLKAPAGFPTPQPPPR